MLNCHLLLDSACRFGLKQGGRKDARTLGRESRVTFFVSVFLLKGFMNIMNTLKGISIVAFAFAMLFISIPSAAQMTDDAVIAYVKEGMAGGKSQDVLMRELASKGVTKAQAERLRARFSSAEGINGPHPANETSDRSRPSAMIENMVVMPESVEERTTMQDPDMVFGRDIFSNRNLTFVPNENIATPASYKLGPGDEVIIDIWGTNQNTIRQTITPDGFINVEGIGLVYLAGMTVKEADAYMRRQLNRIYSLDGEDAQSEIKLTLGAIRTIMVNVMGEVAVPGTYSLSSLSTVYHALYRAGGFSDLGSVRNVELVRDGKKISDVDIYDFIINGSPAEDVVLQDGDIILVPTYEAIAAVRGNVKRPVMYEMKEGETVADLIRFAGGFKGDAYTRNLNLVRRNGREMQVYTIPEQEFSSFRIADGDSLTVGAVLDRYQNRIEIRGAVYRPGAYQLTDATSTVKGLVEVADGLMGDAFLNRVLIYRELPDFTKKVIALDLKNIINGTSEDVVLQNNDVLYIPSIYDLRDVGTVNISGEVALPGSYDYVENMTIEDLIINAGGLLESASTAKIDVNRRIKDASSTSQSDKIGEMYTFTFKDGYVVDMQEDFVLQPYDYVYVRKSPSYMPQSEVTVSGEVAFPGVYALTERSERISNLVGKAGGVNQWAYIKGARLSRRMNEEEKARMKSTMDVIDSARDSIDVSDLDIEERYSVGIDLMAALANPGSDDDLVLRAGDILYVPQYINTVKITGNVMYPNTVTYSPDMTVGDFVKMAGGYGYKAKKSKAYVIYSNGTVARARRSSASVVEPGCEIVIPNKRQAEGSLEKFLSIATTSSSVATMLATVGNIVMNTKSKKE